MDQTKTLAVPEAGRRYFNLGKNASYEAARRGEIPVIKIGSRLRVPIIALERMLERVASGQVDESGTGRSGSSGPGDGRDEPPLSSQTEESSKGVRELRRNRGARSRISTIQRRDMRRGR